ncbi:hypothetical protein BBJ28_00005053 [Nothophytophthora sp. Chile5]|nr:hypothetical protein BBJ28_00005053 [Nothophytophthora sp. Chile5]
MEATWQRVVLADASGALTTAGTRLLDTELADERLAVVMLIGGPSTRAARRELMAKLLELREDAAAATATAAMDAGDNTLTLLASVSYLEEDYRVLVLDLDTSEGGAASPALEKLAGALCALSSLVVSCFDELGSISCLLPSLPAFQTLFQTIVREYAAMEVFELLPKMASIDFSPTRSLTEKLASVANGESAAHDAEGLDGLVGFKQVGVLYPRSIGQMHFQEVFGTHAAVKRIFGSELTGEVLGFLLRKLAHQALEQEPLDFGDVWDDLVEQKCRVLAEDALNTYVDCVHPSVLEHPPMELGAFTQLHEEISRLSMDVYHAASKFKSARHRKIRSELKAGIRAQHEAELSILKQKSREYCEELRRTLWADLSTRALQSRDGETFAAMLAAIQEFDTQFNEKARGPEKAAVLRDFYRQEAIRAFQQLEDVVTQQLSESRLQELRFRLEKDYETKTDALVEHFKQEEAQLRVGMERDKELMQKMHNAKAARVKIDGSEANRLREELNELKRQQTELEGKAIVLEHSQQDAVNQKAVLTGKVEELEIAVRREVASRTELVDTLALTIKTAEEKEETLIEKVAALQLELGEKTFRVEGELQELAHKLRKTNEVRRRRHHLS